MNWGSCKLYIPLAWTVTAVALSLSTSSHAAEWKITPSLDLSETYTDNVRLSSSGTEKGDYVTQVSPGISVSGTGSRLKVNMNYMMQNTAHANESSQITTSHQLNADGNAELLEHLLFLDGKAGLSQQNISLFGPQPTDNTNITGNRATVATYSISPYLRHRFDTFASSDLRYAHDEVRTGVGGLSNSKGDSALFNLNSGPAFRRMGWGLHYSKHITEYSNNPTDETETFSGNLRVLITPKFSLTATKGHEKNNYISIGTKPEGDSWTAGFAWTPTAKTSLEASTGHRFFGKTYTLAASHRSRSTVWSVNYSEDITSTRSQLLNPFTTDTATFLQPILDSSAYTPEQKQNIKNFIQLNPTLPGYTNAFSNRFFLQKRLQTSVALNSAKSTLVLSAFNSLQEAQTAQEVDTLLLGSLGIINSALNDNTKQIGGNALWSWRFSPRSNVNVSAGYTKSRSISTGIIDTNRLIALGMTKQFRSKLSGSVNWRHNERDTTQSGGNSRENAITANLHMTF